MRYDEEEQGANWEGSEKGPTKYKDGSLKGFRDRQKMKRGKKMENKFVTLVL